MRERLATVNIDIFRDEVEKNLEFARRSLGDSKLTRATTALDENDALLLRYHHYITQWKSVVDYAAELEQRVARATATGTETYRRALRDAITAIRLGAVEAATPSVVADALEPYPMRVRHYLELDEILVEGSPDVKKWRRELDSLTVADDAGLAQLLKEVVEQLQSTMPAGAMADIASVTVDAIPKTTDSEIIAGKRASRRRTVVFYIGLGLAFVTLAAGGFHQLYTENATFGGWDYVMIGLWGLSSSTVPGSVATGSSTR